MTLGKLFNLFDVSLTEKTYLKITVYHINLQEILFISFVVIIAIIIKEASLN